MIEFVYDSSKESLVCAFPARMDSPECSEAFDLIFAKLSELSGPKPSPSFKVVFDLAKTDYASSSFLRIVVMTAKKIAKGNFSVANSKPFIRDLFRTAGLEQWLAQGGDIETVTEEDGRVFPPPPAFAREAHIGSMEEYKKQHRASLADPAAFWGNLANEHIEWVAPWKTVCEWELPYAKWFVGGKLNVSYNCLDKHLNTPRANKAAIIWEGEAGTAAYPAERVLTYRQLHREVCLFANVLRRNGVTKGDRVILYLPMVPEAAVAMHACARLGAIHSVVFGGFSAQSVAERVKDCGAKLVVTADGSYRRGAIVQLKQNVDEALEIKGADGRPLCASVQKVIVLRRASNEVYMEPGRDVWWHEETAHVNADCPPEPVDSEHVLFILYTSGSTGKPKGVFHSTAGYLLGAKLTHHYVFDIKETDVFWCTADIGWITGHSYVVYGPLANGSTVLMYEGAPNFPDPARFWRIIEKYGVTIFYTAPTAIRAFMKWGDKWPQKHDISSLRLLGTVGEPINPQAWIWYNEVIGKGRCPIVDTWWQTETGSIMISPLPGAVPTKPGSASVPFFGVKPEVVDDKNQPVGANAGGTLVVRHPWPSMLRGVWGDPDRYKLTYWSDVPGSYYTGDGARCDKDGYFWIMGRIDDVLNVSGHRIGTAEVESALVSHTSVAEAAVVGRPDDVKGLVVIAFVTLKTGMQPTPTLRDELRQHVGKEVGAIAKPEEIRFADALPKTRSGKIMRRLLKQVAAGTEISGDVTTLEDFSVLARLSGEQAD
ncbi:MAG: acetate--CoA ligase [Planctomycetota bacterium]